MDRYLVAPLAKWIVFSTGWTERRAIGWARLVIVVTVVTAATVFFFYLRPDRLLP